MENPGAILDTIGFAAQGVYSRTFTNDKKDSTESADNNALNNASGAANSNKETASLSLRGYPLLKAKTTLEITGVGKGSGVWYCKTVVQQWSVDHGYITNAQLLRGGDGGGGGEGGGGEGGNVQQPAARV